MIGIIGATGFVGNHLIRGLKNKNLITIGRKSIQGYKNIYFDLEKSQNLVLPKSIDTIIHLAAITRDSKSKSSKAKIYRANVLGTKKVLQAIKKSNVKRIIFLSTLKVYGEKNSKTNPITINSKLNPNDEYSKSKIEAEKLIINFSKDNDLNYVLVRPPMIYGPGNLGNFSLLIKILKLPLPMPFKAFNANRRSFLSIYNLVDLLIHLLNNEVKNEILLASDNDDISTFDLIKLISQKKKKPKIYFSVNPNFFKLVFTIIGMPNIFDKLNSDLYLDFEESAEISGWKPKYTLVESLENIFYDT